MQTVNDINSTMRKHRSSLLINGQNFYDISLTDPAAAHKLVFEAIEARGGLEVLRRRNARQSCIKEAMAKPLPGAAGDAFLRGSVEVGEELKFQVHGVFPITHLALQAIESPLLKLVGNAASKPGEKAGMEFTLEDEWRVCFIFTEHPASLFCVWKKDNAALAGYILDGAQAKFETVPSEDVNAICTAVLAQYHRFVQATIRRRAQLRGQVENSFFLALEPEPSKPMA